MANFTSNEVSAYSIASNGTLTPLPDSPFPAGVRPVSVAITRCTKPPTITDASVNPAVLWPPNHKMVDVTVNYDVTAGCGTTTTSLSVTSNEPVNGTDWVVLSPNNVDLRADRLGTGTGRIYTITIFCQDSLGTSSSATVTVRVPHDNGH